MASLLTVWKSLKIRLIRQGSNGFCSHVPTMGSAYIYLFCTLSAMCSFPSVILTANIWGWSGGEWLAQGKSGSVSKARIWTQVFLHKPRTLSSVPCHKWVEQSSVYCCRFAFLGGTSFPCFLQHAEKLIKATPPKKKKHTPGSQQKGYCDNWEGTKEAIHFFPSSSHVYLQFVKEAHLFLRLPPPSRHATLQLTLQEWKPPSPRLCLPVPFILDSPLCLFSIGTEPRRPPSRGLFFLPEGQASSPHPTGAQKRMTLLFAQLPAYCIHCFYSAGLFRSASSCTTLLLCGAARGFLKPDLSWKEGQFA